jgi:hypothetical protein
MADDTWRVETNHLRSPNRIAKVSDCCTRNGSGVRDELLEWQWGWRRIVGMAVGIETNCWNGSGDRDELLEWQ